MKLTIDPNRVSVFGNAINTDIFKPTEIKKKTNNLITIGRLTEQKNLSPLIKAVARANVKLTIVGQGELETKLKKLAQVEQASIEWIPKVKNEDIPNLLSQHKAFVLVSHYEGNPKALLEAMACELPCIVSDIKEHLFIQDKETGFKTKQSIAAIKATIEHVLTHPELKTIGKNARHFILKNHSTYHISQKEANLYTSWKK